LEIFSKKIIAWKGLEKRRVDEGQKGHCAYQPISPTANVFDRNETQAGLQAAKPVRKKHVRRVNMNYEWAEGQIQGGVLYLSQGPQQPTSSARKSRIFPPQRGHAAMGMAGYGHGKSVFYRRE